MYTLYDQYQDLMSGRISSYTYEGKMLFLNVHPGGNEIIVTYVTDNKERYQAHAMRKNIDCMTALQGISCLLLHEKNDLWFDRHGNLCTKEEFSPIVTKEQRQEDALECLIDSVMDISIDDKDPLNNL